MIFQKNQKFLKLPKLHAPSISLSAGTVITINNPASNGNFAKGWELYKEGEPLPIAILDLSETYYDLYDYSFESGENKFYARLTGTGFKRSDASESVTITM